MVRVGYEIYDVWLLLLFGTTYFGVNAVEYRVESKGEPRGERGMGLKGVNGG
jgi:hypothetical protein